MYRRENSWDLSCGIPLDVGFCGEHIGPPGHDYEACTV